MTTGIDTKMEAGKDKPTALNKTKIPKLMILATTGNNNIAKPRDKRYLIAKYNVNAAIAIEVAKITLSHFGFCSFVNVAMPFNSIELETLVE